jgi:hypothetical protein
MDKTIALKTDRARRKSHAFRATLAAAFAAILALAGTSCMTSPGAYRGSLSDAMNKARDDNEGSRSVPSKPPKNREVAPPVHSDKEAPVTGRSRPDTEESEPVEWDGDLFFGARGGIVALSSIPRAADGWGDLLVGSSGETMDAVLFAGMKAVMPSDGSSLDLSTRESLLFFRAGGEMRFLPFGESDAFAPYFGAGVSAFAMFWQFQNPVYSLGDRIDGDAISGVTLSASAGLYVIRSEHVNVALSVTPEVSFFYDTTFQGFANDWFAPYGSIAIGTEIFFK